VDPESGEQCTILSDPILTTFEVPRSILVDVGLYYSHFAALR
jgi:hypothetical protein